MSAFRNGSLPANALLIVIGAAAGVGVSVLIAPLREKPEGKVSSNRSPGGSDFTHRKPALVRKSAEATVGETPGDRADSLREAGAEAARSDPAHALLLAQNFTSDQDKLEFLRGIYSVWSNTDPLAALEYAKTSLPAGLARSETIGIAVNKWSTQDPRAAWLWTEANLSGPLKEQAFTDVLVGWTRRSPEAAAQWLASTGSNSTPLLAAVAATWAEQDPRKAAKWSASLPPTEQKSTNIPVAAEWANQQPRDAAEHFTPDISKPDGAALATTIAGIWGTTDPAATAAWIDELPASPGKDEAAATLATVWAASDIQAAVAWSGKITDESMRRQIITHIGTTWGAIEPDGALNWLYSLPAELASNGIAGAFNSWAATDATALREWVDSTPVSEDMDQARLALAEVTSDTDPLASLDLAAQLSSEHGRDDATARFFRHWRKTDDPAAQEWLIRNWANLAPSTRIRLTREQKRLIAAR